VRLKLKIIYAMNSSIVFVQYNRSLWNVYLCICCEVFVTNPS